MPGNSSYRGRFAPSPTGPLHFGSLVTAFGSWLLARAAGGEWWIRVEDLDPPREIPGAALGQLATLQAFGLHSDAAIEWQGQHGQRYQSALDRLLAEGKAFVCHCSRAELANRGGIHHHCVAAQPRRNPSMRLRVPAGTVISFDDGLQGRITQDVGRDVGDFVLKRADGLWAYQLAVVADDAAQRMTDVVRGADLLDSTPRQILLQQALGLPTPRYLHLPLIVDAAGQKLSKSFAALPVDATAPLPALRLAWQALGQDAKALAGITTVASTLQAARASFVASDLPAATVSPVAAVHNITDTNAV